MRRNVWIMGGATVALALGVWAIVVDSNDPWPPAPRVEGPPVPEPSDVDLREVPLVDAGDTGTTVSPREPQLRFVGASEPLTVTVGGPAFYPPFEGMTTGGLPLPTDVDGVPVDHVEVLAVGGSQGFWGAVTLPAQVDLVPMIDVEVCTDAFYPGAKVRLARREIGFVAMHATMDAPCVTFRAPTGSYLASVWAPGHLTRTAAVPSDVPLSLPVAALVRGTVRAAGRGLAGAWVSAVTPDGVVGITETDANGDYVIDAVPGDRVRIHALAEGFAPTRSPWLKVERVVRQDLDAVAGVDVRVRVATPDGNPVSAATVAWVLEDLHGWAATDAAGEAQLRGVPPGAFVQAHYRTFHSPREAATADIDLVLDGIPTKPLRLRVDGADVSRLRAWDAKGAACDVVDEGRHWVLEGCQPGTGVVVIDTPSGPHEWRGVLDGATIEVPESKRVVLRLTGNYPWATTPLFARLGDERVPLQVRNGQTELSTVSKTFELSASGPDPRRETFTSEAQVDVHWDLTPRASLRVVDAQNAPVQGAWVAVVKDHAVLDRASSGGLLPVEFAVPEGARVFAVDARRGQGEASSDGLIRLTGAVDPDALGLMSRGDVEAFLGVSLVPDGNGLRIDPIFGRRASKANIERGAWFIAAYRTANATVLVYEVGGKQREKAWESADE